MADRLCFAKESKIEMPGRFVKMTQKPVLVVQIMAVRGRGPPRQRTIVPNVGLR